MNIDRIVEKYLETRRQWNTDIYFSNISVDKDENTDIWWICDFYSRSESKEVSRKKIEKLFEYHDWIEDILFENCKLYKSDLKLLYSWKFNLLKEVSFEFTDWFVLNDQYVSFINKHDSIAEISLIWCNLDENNFWLINSININNLKTLYFSNNNINEQCIKKITSFLSNQKLLSTLSFYDNDLWDNWLKILLKHITKDLIFLDIWWNNFTDNSSKILIDYIRLNDKMEELFLDNNNFSKWVLLQILDELNKKNSFSKITIFNNEDIVIDKKYNFIIVDWKIDNKYEKIRDCFIFWLWKHWENSFSDKTIYYINRQPEELIQSISKNKNIRRICYTSLSEGEFMKSIKALESNSLSLITFKNIVIKEEYFIKALYKYILNNTSMLDIRFYEHMPLTEKGVMFFVKNMPKSVKRIYFKDDILMKITNKNLLKLLFIDTRVVFDLKWEYINKYK